MDYNNYLKSNFGLQFCIFIYKLTVFSNWNYFYEVSYKYQLYEKKFSKGYDKIECFVLPSDLTNYKRDAPSFLNYEESISISEKIFFYNN